MLAEILEVTLEVGARLDRLGVAWVVGGSFADESSRWPPGARCPS